MICELELPHFRPTLHYSHCECRTVISCFQLSLTDEGRANNGMGWIHAFSDKLPVEIGLRDQSVSNMQLGGKFQEVILP